MGWVGFSVICRAFGEQERFVQRMDDRMDTFSSIFLLQGIVQKWLTVCVCVCMCVCVRACV